MHLLVQKDLKLGEELRTMFTMVLSLMVVFIVCTAMLIDLSTTEE